MERQPHGTVFRVEVDSSVHPWDDDNPGHNSGDEEVDLDLRYALPLILDTRIQRLIMVIAVWMPTALLRG